MIVVCGAGGFIGGHLVKHLIGRGETVTAVDLKPLTEWYQLHAQARNLQADLQLRDDCIRVLQGAQQVYNLASDMGGMGFIANNKALCSLNVLINTHLLLAAQTHRVERFFFASSACVYAQSKQDDCQATPLAEEDAYPAMPEDGYGWEKLFGERMCRHFSEDFGLATRIARFHNIYGPHGSYKDGREKAPAAICRKIIEAKLSGTNKIEIWGDGNQSRSFTYIDDCLHGIDLLMNGEYADPVNVGSSEVVTINRLVDLVEEIAGMRLKRVYDPSAPLGVKGRNSDNELINRLFDWEPSTRLKTGLENTYRWIYDDMIRTGRKQVAMVPR